MGRGIFISFEGIDKSGKTTQINRLAQWLQQRGAEVLVTREPGGTKLAEKLRSLLVSSSNYENMQPLTETFLMVAARTEHVAQVIRPALQRGKVVLCDRFIDSTVAYQGYGLGVDLNLINELNEAAIGDCLPDLTFLLDLPVTAAQGRGSGSTSDRIEQREQQFHRRVRTGFLAQAEGNSQRMAVIQAQAQPAAVQAQLVELVAQRFSRFSSG